MGESGGNWESEQPPTGALNRRNMLKAAVAAGAGAAAWAAPDIKTLGFKPALAQTGTDVTVLSPESDDKNSNDADGDCFGGATCCGQQWGNAGNGSPDTWTFTSPIPGCNSIVVRLDTSYSNMGACDINTFNPDIAQSRLVIDSVDGANCGNCTILEAVVVESSGRTEQFTVNNGPAACGGIDISISDCSSVLSNYRLAVRISCTIV